MADDLLTMKIAIDDRDYLKVQRSQKNFQYSLVEIERAYRNSEITSKQYNKQLVIQTKNLQKLGFTYSEASSQIRKYAFSLRKATQDQLNHAQAMSMSGKGMRRFELIAQQAGYQVGDFAVQVQSGTNVAVAFGQQMSQLLGFFGAGGALAGAAIAIGTAFVAPLMRAKEEVESLQDTTSKAIDELEAKLRQTRLGVSKEEIGFIDRLAEAQSKYEEALENYNIERNAYLQNPTMTPDEIEDLLSVEAENMAAAREEAAKAADEYDRFLAARTALSGGAADIIEAFGGEGDPQYSPEALKKTEEWLEGFEDRRLKLAASRFKTEMAYLKAAQEKRKKDQDEEQKRVDRINKLFDQRYSTLDKQRLQNSAKIKNYNDELGLLIAQQEIRRTDLILYAQENDFSAEQKRQLKSQLSILEDQERQLLEIKEEEKERVKRAKELKELFEGLEFPDYGKGVVAGDILDPRGETGITYTEALRRQLIEGRTNVNIESLGGKDKTKTKKDPIAEMLKEVRHKTKLLDLTEEEIRAEEIRYQLEKAGVKNTDDRIDRLIKESEAYYKLNEERDKQKVRIDEIGDAFSDMLMDIVDGTAKADEAFKSFMSSVLKQLYQEMAIDPAVSFLKSFLADGGVMSRGRLTAFANGGVVNGPTVFPMANGMGLMGEAGPEAIMPLKRGPDGKLGVEGSGGVTVVQNINVSTGVQQTVRTEIKSLMPQIAEASKAAVADAKRRGGSYGRNFA